MKKQQTINVVTAFGLAFLLQAKDLVNEPLPIPGSQYAGCGNTDATKGGKCDGCGGSESQSNLDEPIEASSCSASTHRVNNGNATRSVPDLQIAGSVGKMPLNFTRVSNTRLSGRNLVQSSFGPESSWSHNYEWVMRDNGGTTTRPIIRLTYPSGGDIAFQRVSGTSTEWLPVATGSADRIVNTGNDYVLYCASELAEYHFKRRTHSVTGGVFYRIEVIKDASSNIYSIAYQDADDKLIRQVSDPAGNWIKLHYEDLALRVNNSTILREHLVPPSATNNWQQFTITPGQEFRYLALYQGNTWRQQVPLRVAELEFYDENNVRITGGTTFGSSPFAPNSQPWRATDGNINTQYQYAYAKSGYVGIDLGPTLKKKVSRIRFRIAAGTNADASVFFVGMNNEMTPNFVISHVEGSDGRQVGYDYNVYTDSLGIFQWGQLTSANYEDLTASTYTYSAIHPAVMPVLHTANDPRYSGNAKNVRYGYNPDWVLGFVMDEYDNATNQPITGIRWDAGTKPKFVYPNGKVNAFEYNHSTGKLAKMINSFGGVTDYTWNPGGFLLSVDDPLGRLTTYTRRADGHLRSTTTPAGSVTTYTRDTAGYIMAVNDNGRITSHIRDAAKRITRTNHPDGTFEEWTYNSFGQKLTHRATNATNESWTYSPTGLLESHTDAAGLLTTYTYNTLNRLASETRHLSATETHTTTYEYNDRGQITKTTHPDATFVQYVYDNNGNRIATMDERAQVTYATYDSLNRKTSDTDANGNVTTYDYTSSLGGGCGCNTGARPIIITHPDGTVTLNAYDKEWRLLSTTEAFGTAEATTTSYTYDVAGQRTSMTDAHGTVTTYAYDLDGRVISTTVAAGTPLARTSTRSYNAAGDLITTTQAAGTPLAVTTLNTYDSAGRMISTTSAHGTPIAATTSVGYNALGQQITITDPLGRITTTTYDAAGRPRDTIAPNGFITRRDYDIASRTIAISTITPVSTRTSTAIYDNRDRTVTTSDENGISTNYYYDEVGLPISAMVSNGISIANTYDGNGNRIQKVISPNTLQQEVTNFTYDSRNRLITKTDSLGNLTTTTYDRINRVTTSARRLTASSTLTTSYSYIRNTTANTLTTVTTDPAGNVSSSVQNAHGETQSSTNPNNETIIYYFNALGQNIGYLDAKGATFTFEYDLLGRRTRRTEPDNTYTAYTYDLLGNMLTMRKPDANLATYTYNIINQPVSKTWNGGSEFTTWGYDTQARLTSVTNQDSSVAYTYHGTSNRVATETTTLGSEVRTVTRAYDANIRLQSVATTAVPHSLNYTYQATTGRLHTINNDGPPPLATYGYENGLVKTITLENGLTTTTLRDAAQRVISHSTAAGSNVKSSVAHGYDAAGRRTYATYEDALGQAYGYDNAGQVKNVIVNTANPATVNPTASPTHAYNYDPAGNRTSSLDNGITTNYNANSVNTYTNISGGGFQPPSQSPTYDPNGNMLSGPVGADPAVLSYDKENRLRTITQNGSTTGYTYDALSRCIESFNNTSPTDNRERYTWSGWTLLNRELFTGTVPTSSFRYTWGLDPSGRQEGAGGVGGLLAIEHIVGSAADVRFPHYDANGNIIALTDSTGNVSARYRYDAFGKVLSATDLDNSNWVSHNIHGFSSKPTFGNTKLLYYGYRFYSPSTGRWINRDPIEERGGINRYAFISNNTLNFLDFLGLSEGDWQKNLERDLKGDLYRITGALDYEKANQEALKGIINSNDDFESDGDVIYYNKPLTNFLEDWVQGFGDSLTDQADPFTSSLPKYYMENYPLESGIAIGTLLGAATLLSEYGSEFDLTYHHKLFKKEYPIGDGLLTLRFKAGVTAEFRGFETPDITPGGKIQLDFTTKEEGGIRGFLKLGLAPHSTGELEWSTRAGCTIPIPGS